VQLLKDSEYQSAGSVGVRKQAAEHFLTTWADGLVPLPLAVRSCTHAPSGWPMPGRGPPALY
jgi:hypothetical protein